MGLYCTLDLQALPGKDHLSPRLLCLLAPSALAGCRAAEPGYLQTAMFRLLWLCPCKWRVVFQTCARLLSGHIAACHAAAPAAATSAAGVQPGTEAAATAAGATKNCCWGAEAAAAAEAQAAFCCACSCSCRALLTPFVGIAESSIVLLASRAIRVQIMNLLVVALVPKADMMET